MTKRGYRADIAFDGVQALPAGALVLVENGTIVGVEPGRAPAPDGCEVTYLPGSALLPGLIDTHSHLCGNSEPDALDRLPGLSQDELDDVIEATSNGRWWTGIGAGPKGQRSSPPAHPSPAWVATARCWVARRAGSTSCAGRSGSAPIAELTW